MKPSTPRPSFPHREIRDHLWKPYGVAIRLIPDQKSSLTPPPPRAKTPEKPEGTPIPM